MAFTVTARHDYNSVTTSTQTVTTSSTTPTANSLLFCGWGGQNDNNATSNFSIRSGTPISGGSLSWVNLGYADDGDTDGWPWGAPVAEYAIGGSAWYAVIGSSPSSFGITVDADTSSAETFFYHLSAFDVTGHDTSTPIRSGSAGVNGAGGYNGSDSVSGSVTLGVTPASGELILCWFGSAPDNGGGFATPTAGSGKTMTAILHQNTGNTQVSSWYRVSDGTESATISCSDVGQAVGNWWAIGLVVNPAPSGATPLFLAGPRMAMRR
jgi:hypothetical protein